MGTHIKFNVNANGGRNNFSPGILYIISGWGYGKSDKKGIRREFWTVSDKFNTQIKDMHIWKSELKRLFDDGKIIETQVKKY